MGAGAARAALSGPGARPPDHAPDHAPDDPQDDTEDDTEDEFDHAHHHHFSGRHVRWAWMLVVASPVLVVLMAGSLWHQAQANATAAFEERTVEITGAILDRLNTYEQVLRGGLGLFEASVHVSRQEWHDYVETLRIQDQYPGIQGIGYSLWLEPDEVADHIAAVQNQGFDEYRIRPAAVRDAYTSIIYIEPFDTRNRRAFGYDMWSETVRRMAMSRTRDTGKTTISGRVTLVQETDSDVQAGFLMYLPHYAGLPPHPTVADRRKALQGFVYSPFRMRDLMEGVVGTLQDVRLTIHDGARRRPEDLMYDSASGTGGLIGPARYAKTATLSTRGHTWSLSFASLPGFRRSNVEESQAVIVLLAGLVSCTFFGFVVWAWTSTRRRAQAMAAETVARLKRRKAELMRSNEDLEQFAYVASHDLRAPLRNMNALLSWLAEDHADELSEGAVEKVEDLTRCAARMDALLNSILAYSRLGSLDVTNQPIDTDALVREAIRLIGPREGIEVTVEGELPPFHGVAARISQVFANLIGNAIKHHDRETGHVTVSGRDLGEYCEFRVCDDGPGIPPGFRDRVFEMFKTLKSRDEVEGSGMGLSIVQKTVQQHGGCIWIEDRGGERGTCFAFTVRKEGVNV